MAISLFLAELLARAGEGGGKASSVDIEGANRIIFWLITPESVSNLKIHSFLKYEQNTMKDYKPTFRKRKGRARKRSHT